MATAWTYTVQGVKVFVTLDPMREAKTVFIDGKPSFYIAHLSPLRRGDGDTTKFDSRRMAEAAIRHTRKTRRVQIMGWRQDGLHLRTLA